MPSSALPDYLLADRQWPRHLRIAHARYQIKKAQEHVAFDGQSRSGAIKFFAAVLKANGARS